MIDYDQPVHDGAKRLLDQFECYGSMSRAEFRKVCVTRGYDPDQVQMLLEGEYHLEIDRKVKWKPSPDDVFSIGTAN